MPYVDADDAIRLYYEETGSGKPVIFVHEFAGNCRTWEPQVRHFARLYRCITFNARGYPPSEVPADDSRYSQARARDDIKAVLDGLDVGRAHVVGHSMGAFAALHFALAYPERTESVVLAGCGYGAEPSARERFLALTAETADLFRREGNPRAARQYGRSPGRLQFERKDPRGYGEFITMLGENSAEGSALTMLNVQRLRPSLWDLQDALRALRTPTLVVTGDEDEPCLEPGLFLKRLIPNAGLVVIPMSGHTINSEEPARFNTELEHFFAVVERKRWGWSGKDG
jgi:pimeloyl-ACP methyl ester carboxylesterase